MSRRIALSLLAAAVTSAALLASPPAPASGADDRPASREALVELGRRLFFDPAIGRQGRVGCSACHDPEHGFSDVMPRSRDEERELPRHSQTLVDLGGAGFHWDGEFDTVRDVIDARVLPPDAAAGAAAARVLRRVRAITADTKAALDVPAVSAALDRITGGGYGGSARSATTSIAGRIERAGLYAVGFRAAFGDAGVTPQRLGDALEAYVGSLKSTASPFDRFLAGDRNAIGAEALRGFGLFLGKAGCAQCHAVDGPRAAFTDGKFHDTGVEAQAASAKRTPEPDFGRLASSFADADRRAYKTPSLRDVARRSPYFHDGSAATLTDVVRYYDKGGTPDDHLDARIRPLHLSDTETADIVAFLGALTGGERAGLGRPTSLRSKALAVHVEDLDGAAVKGVVVRLRAFGDRLSGTSSALAPTSATTDVNGDAVVELPGSTHVVVEAAGAAPSRPLPDWTKRIVVIEAAKDCVSLRVRFPDGAADRPSTFFVFPGGVRNAARPMRQFFKVRDLSPAESLYATPADASTTGTFASDIGLPGAIKDSPAYDIDFKPGSGGAIDLRDAPAPPDRPSLESLSRDIEEIRKLGKVPCRFT